MTRTLYYPTIDVPDHVENEDAYISAAHTRIDINRRKGAWKRWMENHEDVKNLHDWLFSEGDYAQAWDLDPHCSQWEDQYPEHCCVVDGKDYRCSCKRVSHPLSFYATGDFMDNMRESINEWGALTDNQTNAVRKSFQRAQEKLHERAVRRLNKIEDERNNSKHVGIINTRREFTLICEKQLSFDGMYGTTYINICKDEEGNVVVYKGSNAFTENVTITVVATVKAHEERDGVAQTIIARPKVK